VTETVSSMYSIEHLTPEQRRVAEASPSARILVTAGPGTGKTHLLITRLNVLVERWGLSPGRDLLVLSFSRAAVREIADRTAASGTDVGYVRARTFDSFATLLLAEFDPEGSWGEEGYDGRIRCATALIRQHAETQEHVAGYAHVLVDEVQDLVGDRAELVKAVLGCALGGFTLLGDPAQGIYNFMLEGEARRVGSKALYDWIRFRYASCLEEHGLTVNHRTQTEKARIALELGAELNDTAPDYRRIMDRLDTELLVLPTLGAVEHAPVALRRRDIRTVVLCRTNGQALLLSRLLYEARLPHRRRRSATARSVPPWVAFALTGVERRRIGKTAFLERLAAFAPPDVHDPERAWEILQRTAPGPGRETLDLGCLEERIRVGDVPDELNDVPECELVVSTIHRAKGLEFDRVVLADAGAPPDLQDEAVLAEECRVLYVALTRARWEFRHLTMPECGGLTLDKALNRWIRRFKWRTADFEILPEDLHREDPPGSFLLESCDSAETQRYLAADVKPGDPVALRLLKESKNGAPRAFYVLEHRGRPVGVTSERFAAVLYRALKLNSDWAVAWPARIDKLYAEGTETVAGTEAAALRAGLGAVGLWLGVRLAGLGELVFDKRAGPSDGEQEEVLKRKRP
jgi:hypothetical protein